MSRPSSSPAKRLLRASPPAVANRKSINTSPQSIAVQPAVDSLPLSKHLSKTAQSQASLSSSSTDANSQVSSIKSIVRPALIEASPQQQQQQKRNSSAATSLLSSSARDAKSNASGQQPGFVSPEPFSIAQLQQFDANSTPHRNHDSSNASSALLMQTPTQQQTKNHYSPHSELYSLSSPESQPSSASIANRLKNHHSHHNVEASSPVAMPQFDDSHVTLMHASGGGGFGAKKRSSQPLASHLASSATAATTTVSQPAAQFISTQHHLSSGDETTPLRMKKLSLRVTESFDDSHQQQSQHQLDTAKSQSSNNWIACTSVDSSYDSNNASSQQVLHHRRSISPVNDNKFGLRLNMLHNNDTDSSSATSSTSPSANHTMQTSSLQQLIDAQQQQQQLKSKPQHRLVTRQSSDASEFGASPRSPLDPHALQLKASQQQQQQQQQSITSPQRVKSLRSGSAVASGRAAGSTSSNKSSTKHTRLNESFDLSNTGSLLYRSFEINENGIMKVPRHDSSHSSSSSSIAQALTNGMNSHKSSVSSNASTLVGSASSQQTTTRPMHSRTSSSSITQLVSPLSPASPTLRHARSPSHANSSSASSSVASPSLQALNAQRTSLGSSLRLDELVVIGTLGRGANGVVAKALHLPSLTLVALKTVSIFDHDSRHQMIKELHTYNTHSGGSQGILSSIQSPKAQASFASTQQQQSNSSASCVLRFLGASFSEGRVTMALELMNRGSLETLVRKHGALAPPSRHPLLRRIALGMTRALVNLHARHQVHRDIKPANALISLWNNQISVKLSDFGLLKQLDNTQAFSSTFVGTLIYLSPERIVGDTYGTPSDIWSLGITLLYLIHGKLDLPSDFFSLLSKVNKNPPRLESTPEQPLPSVMCDFVNSCLVVNAEQRSTAEQLLRHPFLTQIDIDSEPLDTALSALIEPSQEELSLLANAVISRFYRLQLQSQHAFVCTSVDESRFVSLAQQLGCPVACIRDAIVSRLNRHLQQPQAQQASQTSSSSGSTSLRQQAWGTNNVAVVAAPLSPKARIAQHDSDDTDSDGSSSQALMLQNPSSHRRMQRATPNNNTQSQVDKTHSILSQSINHLSWKKLLKEATAADNITNDDSKQQQQRDSNSIHSDDATASTTTGASSRDTRLQSKPHHKPSPSMQLRQIGLTRSQEFAAQDDNNAASSNNETSLNSSNSHLRSDSQLYDSSAASSRKPSMSQGELMSTHLSSSSGGGGGSMTAAPVASESRRSSTKTAASLHHPIAELQILEEETVED